MHKRETKKEKKKTDGQILRMNETLPGAINQLYVPSTRVFVHQLRRIQRYPWRKTDNSRLAKEETKSRDKKDLRIATNSVRLPFSRSRDTILIYCVNYSGSALPCYTRRLLSSPRYCKQPSIVDERGWVLGRWYDKERQTSTPWAHQCALARCIDDGVGVGSCNLLFSHIVEALWLNELFFNEAALYPRRRCSSPLFRGKTCQNGVSRSLPRDFFSSPCHAAAPSDWASAFHVASS